MSVNTTLPTVNVIEAKQLITQGAQLIDVRENHEWESGHVPTAKHIPLGTLPTLIDEIDRSIPTILCCRAGSRSSRATTFLIEQGFNAINLDGGITEWVAHGQAIVNSQGEIGTVA